MTPKMSSIHFPNTQIFKKIPISLRACARAAPPALDPVRRQRRARRCGRLAANEISGWPQGASEDRAAGEWPNDFAGGLLLP